MKNQSQPFSKIAQELRATLAEKEESLTVDQLGTTYVTESIQKIKGQIDTYEKDHLALIEKGNIVTPKWIEVDKATVQWFKERIAEIGE
jgi:hypothetical protein